MPLRASPAAAPQILEEIAFQKAAVSRLRREIGDVDRNSRRRYIREFHDDFSTYESEASWDDLVVACYKADIVYIGDYHALPGSQEFAARLLDAIGERSRKVVLALEMVYGRHQKSLDRFMAGALGEDEFLRAIRYRLDWGYDWPSFRRLFEVARKHQMPVFGIDCGPRSGFRHIRRRDRYASERLCDVLERHPGARLVVVFGESHLARTHLPGQLTTRLKRRGIEKRRLVVLQNLEDVYWRMLADGHEGFDVARLAPDAYCHFNTGPIAKYEAYRRLIEVWRGESDQDGEVDLTSTVHGVIDIILGFLRVDKLTWKVRADGRRGEPLVDLYPEVYSAMPPRDLHELLRGAGFDADEMREIADHVGRSGSCYVPRINAVFIGQFNLTHAGEEAAHFVNQALKDEIGDRTPRALAQHDMFYTGVMEEALGFFGSKLVDPSRNHFFETDLYPFQGRDREIVEAATPYTYEELKSIIHFIVLHKRFEQSYESYDDVPEEILAGIRSEPRRANVLVHELGYFLGQQLHDAYRRGLLDRDDLLALFRARFRRRGSALSAYLDIARKVAPVLPGGLARREPVSDATRE